MDKKKLIELAKNQLGFESKIFSNREIVSPFNFSLWMHELKLYLISDYKVFVSEYPIVCANSNNVEIEQEDWDYAYKIIEKGIHWFLVLHEYSDREHAMFDGLTYAIENLDKNMTNHEPFDTSTSTWKKSKN